ncbi:FmdB family zinc ribbon protein [Geomicrobium sp. JSM 1781026]|uniref:FmdB family zinc ribbon protein n=1 Tax=Geomicrobium sp. JSM 1781026 TaxID=3344580 RepID=UPI0035C14870
MILLIYSFSCPTCGQFEERHTTSTGDKTKSSCPQCQQTAKRVFTKPNTFSMNPLIKNKIDRGTTPTVTNTSQLKGKKISSSKHNPRPWQI